MYKVEAVATVTFTVPNVNCAEHAENRVRKMLRTGHAEGVVWKTDGIYDPDIAGYDVDFDINTVECVNGPAFSPHAKRKVMKLLTDGGFTDDEIERIMDDGVGD